MVSTATNIDFNDRRQNELVFGFHGATAGLYGGTLGQLVLSLYRQMKLSPER